MNVTTCTESTRPAQHPARPSSNNIEQAEKGTQRFTTPQPSSVERDTSLDSSGGRKQPGHLAAGRRPHSDHRCRGLGTHDALWGKTSQREARTVSSPAIVARDRTKTRGEKGGASRGMHQACTPRQIPKTRKAGGELWRRGRQTVVLFRCRR